ncbi:MAG: metalloregulator ArsR/SmtB family transcription factor [Chromatiales bacterium]|jgi:ArsR family transcriptional regulator
MLNISPESVFSALANSTRLRCVLLLLEYDELCVCELTYVIGAAQPNMSRNLAQLREAGLVSDRREGQWIHYRISPDLPVWVLDILHAAASASADIEPFQSDRKALGKMPNRPGAPRCA